MNTISNTANTISSTANITSKEWVSTTGFNCFVLRHPSLGHWCGYVGVPTWHSDNGIDYVSLGGIDVHGGLTYSKNHKPNCLPDGYWWLGFDCCHVGDYVPYASYCLTYEGETFKDLEFVVNECERLAAVLLRR